ncbi:MAG: DedA family protein [Candidatus Magnetoovum sp. WYHC-5]|nr:DedA family protein [Candidatus Magnetoovum sp. WYHC-5]
MIDFVLQMWDILMHIDKHLYNITLSYGLWTYGILFFIIFFETGFVVTPFLPGDSLLFAAGAIASLGSLHPGVLILLLSMAAIIGDNLNYWIGYYIGPKVFYKDTSFLLNKKYLQKTKDYYDKHGGKTIIIARFIPIIRTFAPFVAGIGRMEFKHFTAYNIVGACLWITIFICGGYFFGNIPIVKKNFVIVIFAIIIISMIPLLIELIKKLYQKTSQNEA